MVAPGKQSVVSGVVACVSRNVNDLTHHSFLQQFHHQFPDLLIMTAASISFTNLPSRSKMLVCGTGD
jgi:hypothetical protein